MKRLYLIPSKVLCIKPRNKNTYIHCSKKNLTESLSSYDIKVTGNTNYRFVELPEGWDVQDERKERICFVDQYKRTIIGIIDRVMYIYI